MLGSVANFEALKNLIAPAGELGRDILHIHIGMAIYLGLRMATRRRHGPLLALAGLAVLEALNETLDLAATWPVIRGWQIHDTLGDIFDTMLWPGVLCASTWVAARSSIRDRARSTRERADA